MSKKRVAELGSPFSSVEWPAVSQEDQDTILELLCTLLAPLGQHRQYHVPPSKGKRSQRRQRQKQNQKLQTAAEPGKASSLTSAAEASPVQPSPTPASAPPPPPELAAFVDIGLAKITRVLAESACPLPLQTEHNGGHVAEKTNAQPSTSPPYTAVFVARSGHPSVFYSHFPQMVAVASRGSNGPDGNANSADSPAASTPIRLVGFSRGCEDRLSACLGIPRVSSIALRAGATQSKGLVDFVRDHVPPVEVRWLQEARAGEHLMTNIHMTQVSVGPKKKKKKKM